MKYTKKELIANIAEVAEISKAEAERQLANVLEGFKKTISQMEPDDKLQLVGLFTVEVKHKDAYTARNPVTGEEVEVPASNRIKIKAGKGLKELVQ